MADDPRHETTADERVKAIVAEALREATPREAWLAHVYEGAARALCQRDGIDPDEVISDSGHLAWQAHAYYEACKHMGVPK